MNTVSMTLAVCLLIFGSIFLISAFTEFAYKLLLQKKIRKKQQKLQLQIKEIRQKINDSTVLTNGDIAQEFYTLQKIYDDMREALINLKKGH